MRSSFKFSIAVMLIAALLLPSLCVALAAETDNPLVEPYEITEYAELPDHVVNILLLGIDFGKNGYWGSGPKKVLEDCHTDSDMVVTINLDKNRIDLVSLPRDTVTYVPGVRGIYKLNAAIHCAETIAEGLQKTKQAAEWLLGNIKIDYYFAVDMGTMIAIGDAIGGVDMELEMSYKGHSRTSYSKGMQHLDGVGITDYLRARTNATVNYTDIGRTNRNRETMLAIFKKLRSDENAVRNLITTAAATYDGFFTDITTEELGQLASMLPMILAVEPDTIGSYVLTGPYKSTLDWNFTYTNQENRQAVIREVYGVDVEPIPYVSSQYAQWLLDTGFTSVHYISVAQQLREYIGGVDANALSDRQKEACDAFEAAYQEAVSAFTIAAKSMANSDTRPMVTARKALRDAADVCASALDYSDSLPWSHNRAYWDTDIYINEYQFDWR